MIKVIPAVLPLTEDELVDAFRRFSDAGVERFHLDICDGGFVPTETIGGYEELARLFTQNGLATYLKVDVHLMVRQPERYVDHWWRCGCADRFIFHVESTDMFDELTEHAHGHGLHVIAALNPDTHIEKLAALSCAYDGVLFMTVHPGAQGRMFLPDVLPKIRRYHLMRPEMPVMVDGGITPDTAPQCIASGASVLVSGSYIIKSGNMKEAIEKLYGGNV